MKYIVNANWVKENLGDLVVIDCRYHLNDSKRGREEYTEEHIPEAFYFDLGKDLSGKKETHGGRHPLPELHILKAKLEAAGVSNDRKVVLYDDQNSSNSARLWWLLKLMGHENTYILDGGFQEWKRQGHPVSNKQPIPKHKGTLAAKENKTMIASVEDVQNKLGEFKETNSYLLDSRDPKRYWGLDEPIDKKAGHIPGALNYFWLDIMENNKWKDQKQLKEHFSKLDPSKEIIVYCGSGVTACPNVLALKEAGFENVKLYAGSWSDWISYEENPIANKES